MRATDVEVAQSELNVAVAEETRARLDLKSAEVTAPANGRVIQIQAYPGQEVGPQGLLDLGKTAEMYVEAEVYETDIARVHPGQHATITSDLFSGDLAGVVNRIGATIAIFGLINAVLLKPLSGIGQPDSIISLQRILRADAYDNFSYPDYQDYRDNCRSLSGLAASVRTPLSLSGAGIERFNTPQELRAAVEANRLYFGIDSTALVQEAFTARGGIITRDPSAGRRGSA